MHPIPPGTWANATSQSGSTASHDDFPHTKYDIRTYLVHAVISLQPKQWFVSELNTKPSNLFNSCMFILNAFLFGIAFAYFCVDKFYQHNFFGCDIKIYWCALMRRLNEYIGDPLWYFRHEKIHVLFIYSFIHVSIYSFIHSFIYLYILGQWIVVYVTLSETRAYYHWSIN